MNRDQTGRDGPDDPRTYFAAERTLLAWVRTGLAMMGLGFVVARFGLFLRELAAMERAAPQEQRLTMSLWVGTTMVILGVAVNLFAAAKHWHTVERLQQGRPIPLRRLSLATVVAVVLGLFGLWMAYHLMTGLREPS